MSPRQELIDRIESFEIDSPGTSGAFAARLAKEQGWPSDFTDRAIKEYKRFVVLAMISEKEVTPSKAVDEVWHLHLIFTDSYWNRMAEILPRPLHHHPGTGAKNDEKRFQTQFQETLDLYRTTFGHYAPSDVWGPQLPAKQPVNYNKLIDSTLAGIVAIFICAVARLPILGFILLGVFMAVGCISVYLEANRKPRRTFRQRATSMQSQLRQSSNFSSTFFSLPPTTTSATYLATCGNSTDSNGVGGSCCGSNTTGCGGGGCGGGGSGGGGGCGGSS